MASGFDPLLNKHQKIVSVLCCPICKKSLTYTNSLSLSDEPIFGNIVCETCGDVGRVINAKFIFNRVPLSGYSGKKENYQGSLSVKPLSLSPEQCFPRHQWNTEKLWNTGLKVLMSEKANAKISLHCNGLSTALILLRHPWSGIARIVLDGVEIAEVDLFEENGAIRWWYPIFLGGEEHIIDVIVTGKKNALSRGSQVWVLGGEVFDIDTTTDVPKFHYSSRNNGNPYPLRFNELINQVHREGLILDCGSGDRSHPDPRVISFEY